MKPFLYQHINLYFCLGQIQKSDIQLNKTFIFLKFICRAELIGKKKSLRYLQQVADRTKESYPAYGKFHWMLSTHCSKVGVSPQTLQQEIEQQLQLTAQKMNQ